jgi:hypothetical protein
MKLRKAMRARAILMLTSITGAMPPIALTMPLIAVAIPLIAVAIPLIALTIAVSTSTTAVAKASLGLVAPLKIKPGAYRVDLNGKVRDQCVHEISNGELYAKGWQTRLSEQGVRCTLANVRTISDSARQISWTGHCSAPGMGKVFATRHDVLVKINADDSFDLLTLISGDLQARIPVRGVRLTENGGACTSQHDTFRPWQ